MRPRTIKSAIGEGWRRARTRVAGSAIVLMYHRVTDLGADPARLAVDVEHFREQMDVLATSYNLLTAHELVDHIARRKRIPERSVVVTLDDGYSDALLNAKPILTEYSVPATVFVCSNYVGGDVEFWWDELGRVVLSSEELPMRLEIEAGFAKYMRSIEPDPGRAAADSASEDNWDITRPPVSDRQRSYLELREFFRPLSPAEREVAMESLHTQFGVAPFVRPSHRPLTAEELVKLGGSGIEIGAHTKSHQLLVARTPEEQRDEVTGSKSVLEQACRCDVPLFSYPYGDVDSFSESSVSTVRNAGFFGAFTTEFGATFPWTDRFRIPRCPSENIGGAQFAERLDRWFEMGR